MLKFIYFDVISVYTLYKIKKNIELFKNFIFFIWYIKT